MSRKFELRADRDIGTVVQQPTAHKRPPFENLLNAILSGRKPEHVQGELAKDILRILGEQGVTSETTAWGDTPLIAAIRHFRNPSHADVVYELLFRRADPNERSRPVAGKRTISPLGAALQMHALEGTGNRAHQGFLSSDRVVRALLAFGANPREILSDGRSLSHHAAASPGKHRTEILIALARYGADVNVVDEDGESPLFVAASCGDGEGARAVLEAGADLKDLLSQDRNSGKAEWDRDFIDLQRKRCTGRTEEEKRRCDDIMSEALREYTSKGCHKETTPEDGAKMTGDSPSYHEER